MMCSIEKSALRNLLHFRRDRLAEAAQQHAGEPQDAACQLPQPGSMPG